MALCHWLVPSWSRFLTLILEKAFVTMFLLSVAPHALCVGLSELWFLAAFSIVRSRSVSSLSTKNSWCFFPSLAINVENISRIFIPYFARINKWRVHYSLTFTWKKDTKTHHITGLKCCVAMQWLPFFRQITTTMRGRPNFGGRNSCKTQFFPLLS